MRKLLSTLLLIVILAVSCNRSTVFPPAGSYSDVVLVTETGKAGGVNDLIIRELQHHVDYYTKMEIQFKLRMIRAFDVRQEPPTKNMVICGVVRRGETGRVIESFIGTNEVRNVLEGRTHIFKKLNYPYSGQLTVIVTASSKERLKNIIKNNGQTIRDIIEEANRERLRDYLLTKEKTEITTRLRSQYGFTLRIPFLYEVLQEREDVPAVEIIRREPHRGITISWQHWGKKGISLADSSKFYEIRSDLAWKMYDRDVMRRDIVFFSEDRLGPYEAIVMDGYWENSEDTFGGPFSSFFIYDRSRKRLWIVDCVVYGPGFNKHTLLRELKAVAETFKTS
ncbi:MAG: DUF4837 family protein [Candidatus Krumholzibacteria bacterium]|nr:DUF4837 family protein [Candidatus Krumholzibacteria bacterium]